MPKNAPWSTSKETSSSAVKSSDRTGRNGCMARSLSVSTCSRGTRKVFVMSRATTAFGCLVEPDMEDPQTSVAWVSWTPVPTALPSPVHLALDEPVTREYWAARIRQHREDTYA